MHSFGKSLSLACLGLLLGCAAIAGARQREAHPGGALALDPGPDGSYAIPAGDGPSVPLDLDAGEAPLRLVTLSFDRASGALQATFLHSGEAPLSAWTVELTTVSASGEPVGSSALTEDWSAGAGSEAPRLFQATGLSPQAHEEGLFFPGQTHRTVLGVAIPAGEGAPRPERLVLSIPVAVFADTSYVGSPRLARQILGDRKAAAEELAYWSVRLEEAAEGARSDPAALEALVALRAELDESSPHLPRPQQGVRRNLAGNLDSVIAEARRRPESSSAELRGLSGWVRFELQARTAHVPRELPEPAAPTPGRGELGQRFHGGEHTDPDPDEDCECGGSLFTSVSQLELRNCNGSATGWTVDETWSYTCRAADGTTLGSGAGVLKGSGGCIEAVPCFPNTYCPPQFSTAWEWEDFDFRYWNRTVLNQQLFVGFCTARCSATTSSSLTFKCACFPRRRPGCNIDGCPILIETGAGGFRLTDLEGGVLFDLEGDGERRRVSWTVAGTDDAWLALDRNGNGIIDDGTELFGDATPQPFSTTPNGFLALALFDRPENGGNGDGRISAADAIYSELLLWVDRNQDGVSDPSELMGLAEAGIEAIELDYRASHRRDRYGNEFRYSALVWLASGGRRLAVDVFLLTE